MAFGIGLVLLNSVLLIPVLQNLFEVATLTTSQVGYIYLFAFIPTLIIQAVKAIRDMYNRNRPSKENTKEEKEKISQVA